MQVDYARLAKGHLDVVVKDKIAVATMNRPDRMNAMGDGMHEAIEDFFQMIPYDKNVNVAVITGAGRGFCAGGDVKAMGDRASGKAEAQRPGEILLGAKRIVMNMVNCEVPTIAAINGPAIGLGCTIALLCDVTFIADTARIGDNHVRVGITAGDGGALIWPYLIGAHKAKELLITGRLITGEEAHKLGLVNHCTTADKVLDEAMVLARELAAGPTIAQRFTKISVNRHIWDGLVRVMDFCLMSEQVCMSSQDHLEATTAFKEKRQPVFKGR